ncbi:MAG: hypothetical protein ACRDOB_00230 [Streptosporangiaceae bacterium]
MEVTEIVNNSRSWQAALRFLTERDCRSVGGFPNASRFAVRYRQA